MKCVWQKRPGEGEAKSIWAIPKKMEHYFKGSVEGDDEAGHHLCVLRTQHELALVLRHLLLLNASLDLLNE